MGGQTDKTDVYSRLYPQNLSVWGYIGYWSYGADRKMHLKQSRVNKSESIKARVVILVQDTLSRSVQHSCKVSWQYTIGYSSYGVDTKLPLKQSRGNNSKSMKARVVILVRNISSSLMAISPEPFGQGIKRRKTNNDKRLKDEKWSKQLPTIYDTINESDRKNMKKVLATLNHVK